MAKNNDFVYDPEAEENTKKYRLPFALCKARGITIEKWWTPKNAWDALKGRFGVEPDEEYKKFYERLKQISGDLSKLRARDKRAQLKDERQNPTQREAHNTGTIDGIEQGAKMSFVEADSGKVNPYYGKGIGYRHNCQTCVATYYARRLGYGVYALPNLNNAAIFALSRDVTLAYKDKQTQQPPRNKSIGNRHIGEQLSVACGNGEILAVSFCWAGRHSGHIVCCEKNSDGEIFLYDPQINKKTPLEDFGRYFDRATNIEYFSLSKCNIDDAFADKIMKGVKK